MYAGEHWLSHYQKIPVFLRTSLIEPLIKAIPDSRDTSVLEHVRRMKRFIMGASGIFEERFFLWNQIMPRLLRESLLRTPSHDLDSGKNMMSTLLNEFQGDSLWLEAGV